MEIIATHSNKIRYYIINYSLINFITTYKANIRKSAASIPSLASVPVLNIYIIAFSKPTVKVRIDSMPWPCYKLFFFIKNGAERKEREIAIIHW